MSVAQRAIVLSSAFLLGAGSDRTAAPRRKPAAPRRFRTVKCVDEKGMGMEALWMLIPSGWRFTGRTSTRTGKAATGARWGRPSGESGRFG